MKPRCFKSPFSRSDGLLALAMIVAWGGVAGAVESAKGVADQLAAPTHRQVRLIRPEVDGKFPKLNTFATTADGLIVAALSSSSTRSAGLVLLLDSEGETLQRWDLELTPTSVTVAPDGTIYVGGSGRIAQLGKDGSVDAIIDSPHIGNVKELREKTAESIRKSHARMSETFGKQIETLRDRVAKIEDKEEDDRTQLEQAQLKAFQSQLEALEKMVGTDGGGADDEAQLDAGVARVMNVTSMAASDQDVFVCATDPSQGGYSVWRIGRDLDPEASERILDGLRGCCGQMDINCCKDQLLVSENTKFQVGIYDRHGRAQGSFGRRDRTSREGFGSCCNPMNSIAMNDGTILTAESSIGHIKRFDQEGNLVAYIGKASIGGGCKHCALGYDEKHDLYYMMYSDKNAICVLANNDSAPLTVAEQKLDQRQREFWARVAGQWSADNEKSKTPGSGGVLSFLLNGNRSSRSNSPISAMTIGADGSAKITEGMYKAYGDEARLELLPRDESDKSDAIKIALAIDQVRFLEGTWAFGEKDEVATLAFPGQGLVTLKRVAGSEACVTECGGADCSDEACTDKNCPKRDTRAVSTAVELAGGELVETTGHGIAHAQIAASVESDNTVETAIQLEVVGGRLEASEYADEMNAHDNDDVPWQTEIPTPRFEYKLLSRKDLGKNAQKALNKLGAKGWEFCGRVDGKMMFKRIGGYDVSENEQ